MSKILVTGVNGFVGHHVAAQLNEAEHSIIGIGNQPKIQSDLKGVVSEYRSLDLTDPKQVHALNLSGVDSIINLAGFANVGASVGQQELYDKINIGIHTVLYEECLRQGVFPLIIAVSTGAVYDPRQELPITEESKLIEENQTNEYVISKKRMEKAVEGLKEKGLDIVIARPFNHSGPGQLPGFLLPDLSEQIEMAHKNMEPLKVGNLKTKRDYTDVRDVARAYALLATTKNLHHSVYNICSGKSVMGEEILESLANAYGFRDLKTEVDPARLRKNDVMNIYGSCDKLKNDTGWEPTIPVQKMIQDFVEWKKTSS